MSDGETIIKLIGVFAGLWGLNALFGTSKEEKARIEQQRQDRVLKREQERQEEALRQEQILDIKIENLQQEIAILKNDLEKFDTLELQHEYYVDDFRAYEIRVNDDMSRNETKTTFKTYGRKR